ncbi:MAG TPA: hypothetical protein VGL86_03585, partial [Polyangia bacterium]
MTRILLLCSFVLLPACGSDNTDGIDDFIESIATQQCSWEYRCCTDAEIKVHDGSKFTTQDACVPYHKLALEDELYTSLLAARQGRMRLDHTQEKACLAMMTSMACNPKAGTPATPPSMAMDACATVFTGVTPVGQACQLANECKKGAHCVFDAGTAALGVCEPYQKEGEICNASTDCDPTVDQIYCAQADWKCHVRAKAGQPCAYTVAAGGAASLPLLLECDTTDGTLYCDPTSSTCKPLPEAGQACLSPPPPGVSSSCDPNPALHLTCRTSGTSSAGTCQGLAKNGEDCSSVACDTGLYCDGTTRTCLPLPTLGQSCSTSGACASPYFCNFNVSPVVCAQAAQLNQPCTDGSICDVNLWCDTTQATPICKGKLADGTACTTDLECLSDDCNAAAPRICNPSAPGAVLCVGR